MLFLSQIFKKLWRPEVPVPIHPTGFIYVKIPDGAEPLVRREKYGDPLETQLSKAGIGHVSGGGSQLGPPQSDGSRLIEFCGLDVDVTDLEKALAFLRAQLPLLRFPDRTELHYTLSDNPLRDVYEKGQWLTGQR